jgi:hypothetical protein
MITVGVAGRLGGAGVGETSIVTAGAACGWNTEAVLSVLALVAVDLA